MELQRTLDANGKPVWTLSYAIAPGDLVALSNILQQPGTLQQLQTDAGTGTSTSPGTPASSQTFKGIYAFSTGNSSALAANASVAGTNLTYPWSLIEPTEGTYNWDLINQDAKPWWTAGKSVMIRVASCGWKKWGPPFTKSNSWTPDWVYAKGVKSVTSGDGTVKPQYWNTTFLSSWNTFIQAFAAQYDGHAGVAVIPVCVGDGGETKVDTHKDANVLTNWQKIGYTDDVWWSTLQTIVGYYKAAFKTTPLALMPDATFIGGKYSMSKVTAYAVQQGIWLQDNGLVKGQKPESGDFKKVPIIVEQRNPTSTSKDTLDFDLAQAIQTDGATIVMVFAQDLQNTANQAVLQKYAALATQ